MALTQAERIQISKKIIDIPLQNAAFDRIKVTLQKSNVTLENEDNANKSLMDDITTIVNLYMRELTQLDGNARVELVESMLVDSANRVKQNFFFPNDVDTSLPNVPDGIWKFFTPFSGSVAIGKNYDESYTVVTKEQDIIDNINAQVSIIESASVAVRSTGDECTAATLPPDTFAPEPVIQQALVDIKAEVSSWRSFLLTQQGLIPTADSDITRQLQNNVAITDITTTIAAIDTWTSYDDFDTTTTRPFTCGLFDSSVSTDYTSSKLRSTELNPLKAEMAARVAFIPTRVSQLNTTLGSVGQDLSTGVINGSGSGLFDDRFKAINIRLSLLGGSLIKKISTLASQSAQDALKTTNDAAADIYLSVMQVSLFRSPASNNGTIHLIDASSFNAGDAIYIVAENQQELVGNIVSIDGNTVFLDMSVPEKYTHENRSRLYKIV